MNSINSQGLSTRMIPIAISTIVIFLFLLFMAPLSYGEDPFFSIALSKFSKEEDAKKEESKLKNSGNNAFYKKEKNPENGNLEYQVYIEKYKSMEEAIKEAKVLKDLEIISNYLVKEVVDTPIIEEPLPEAPLEGADTPQPEGDAKQVSEAKTGLSEKKLPVSDAKIVEGQTPLTVKKDTPEKISETKPDEVEGQTKITGQKVAEKKIPVTEIKEVLKATVDTESTKVEAPSPQADKKEDVKKASEAATKEQVGKSPVPEQEKTSGQIKKESIPIEKEAIKQAPAPEKPEEQVHTTDQKATNDSILKPEIIEPQKQEQSSGQIRREPIPVQKETVQQAPESKPVKNETNAASTKPVTGEKTILKEAPTKIISNEAVPEKAIATAADQTPVITVPVSEKVPEKKVPVSVEISDQAKGATLQVGACKEEANAAILKKQLLSLGRTAFYRHESAERMGDIYRIYITGYNTLGDAVKDAKALVESGVIKGYARPNMKNPAADMQPQKVEATANETGNSIYLIHTGSYKEEVNALRAVAMLKESGYKAIYVPEKDATVTWFRVYIGDFRSEAQAREKGLELLDKGIITYFKPVAITPQEKAN